MKLLLSLLLCLSASAADLLLVLQRDLPISAEPHVAAWQSQVTKEGYTVTRAYGPRANPKAVGQARDFAASTIWPWVRSHPGGYVFLIGDLPMPRSGLGINPDGHAGSSGAYASTLYYAAPTAEWTDEGDNLGYLPRAPLINLPGDGHMDQTRLENADEIRAKIGFFNPYYNPKTFLSTLDSIDYVTDSLRRYFALDIAYRRGELKPTKLGLGIERGDHSLGMVAWAGDQVGSNNVLAFTRATSVAAATNQFLFTDDMKGFSESNAFWSTRATGNLLSVFDKTGGSYQVDYRTLRLANPLNCGTLAVGNIGRMWNMANWQTKTLGELWIQTIISQRLLTHIVLYGDPTLRLQFNQ